MPVLQNIERAAGRLFRDVGMFEIADDEPLSLDELLGYQQAGRAWVAADSDDVPAAYLIADLVEGNLHIEQVSVHPRFARRRIGRQLLDHLARHALVTRVPALTLTTFASGLRSIRQHETAAGWTGGRGSACAETCSTCSSAL